MWPTSPSLIYAFHTLLRFFSSKYVVQTFANNIQFKDWNIFSNKHLCMCFSRPSERTIILNSVFVFLLLFMVFWDLLMQGTNGNKLPLCCPMWLWFIHCATVYNSVLRLDHSLLYTFTSWKGIWVVSGNFVDDRAAVAILVPISWGPAYVSLQHTAGAETLAQDACGYSAPYSIMPNRVPIYIPTRSVRELLHPSTLGVIRILNFCKSKLYEMVLSSCDLDLCFHDD